VVHRSPARELEGARHVAGVLLGGLGHRLAARIARLGRQQRHLAGRRVAAPALVQLLELLAERVDVVESVVDGGVADVRDLVEVAELLHDDLADDARGDLALAQHAQAMADALDRGFDRLAADGTLLERLHDARAQLALVEGLASAVVLDDLRHDEFRRLEGREALAAGQAFAAAADLVPLALRGANRSPSCRRGCRTGSARPRLRHGHA
jgi:hypothetical protein